LRVHAERREETKSEDKGSYRSEFRYGSFTRVVPLPAGATEKDVKATYKDGILEIRVPVDRAVAEATKIPVQRV
jgi:HSP20 family protein